MTESVGREQVGFLAHRFTLLAKNDSSLFVGTPEGKVLGIHTKFLPDVQLEWFRSPVVLERTEFSGVLALPMGEHLGQGPLAFQQWQDEATGLEVVCVFQQGKWYVVNDN